MGLGLCLTTTTKEFRWARRISPATTAVSRLRSVRMVIRPTVLGCAVFRAVRTTVWTQTSRSDRKRTPGVLHGASGFTCLMFNEGGMDVVRTCRPHPCSNYHRHLVETYRERVQIWLALCEDVTQGYTTEMSRYVETNPCPLFKDHLKEYAKEMRGFHEA